MLSGRCDVLRPCLGLAATLVLVLFLSACTGAATPTPTITPSPTPPLTVTTTPTLVPTPTATPTQASTPQLNVVFSSAEVPEEAIRYQQNRSQIVNEFTRAVLKGQIREGSFKSFAATSGDRSDLIDIWYLEGLQTGNGFRIGLTSSFQELGDVSVREIKGNLFLVLKNAPPKQSSQRSAGSGRARLTQLSPVLQSLEKEYFLIALATGDQLPQPLGQVDAAIAFGTGELLAVSDNGTLFDRSDQGDGAPCLVASRTASLYCLLRSKVAFFTSFLRARMASRCPCKTSAGVTFPRAL